MMRILAISDIHGCYDKLKELLDKVQYTQSQDKLILLGDYVDRGQDPMKTLFFIDELVKNGAIALMGNHDSMFLDLIQSNQLESALYNNYYYRLGSINTILDYKKLPIEKRLKINYILKNLLPYYTLDNYIFVHGGVNSSIPLEKNDFQDLIWLRNEFYYKKAYDNKIVIFGHTPTCNINEDGSCKIWYDDTYKDKIGIDCACVYNGKLACLDLTNNIEYYV